MKKLISVLLAAVLLFACFMPAAAAAETQPLTENETSFSGVVSAEEMRARAESILGIGEGQGKTPAKAPAKARSKAESEPSYDLKALADVMYGVMCTGEPADVLNLRIPYNDDTIDEVCVIPSLDARFLWCYPNYEYDRADGVRYFSRVTVTASEREKFLERRAACDDVAAKLTRGLIGDTALSDADICLILHDRLLAWCEYDYQGNLSGGQEGNAVGPLVYRHGVCMGIALAYNYLLDKFGIEAEYARSSTHSHGWSMVWLNGEAYYVDPTWDDLTMPGGILHNQFLIDYETFGARHWNDISFPTTPTSTLYLNYYTNRTRTEVAYINGTLYYFVNSTGKLIARTPAGEETEILQIPTRYYAYEGAQGQLAQPRMTAIGDTLLYLKGREVYGYNTVTGTESLVYTPSAALFPEDNYFLTGIEQRDGVVTVFSHNNYIYTNTSTIKTLEQQYSESFTFCDHEHLSLVERLKGTDCETLGEAKKLCLDCGAYVYTAGEGIYGDHDYSAEIVSDDTRFDEATCACAAKYHYTCAVCGEIENNDAHYFTSGETLPHTFDDETVAATDACPGYDKHVCVKCGAIEYDNFTFYTGATASGTLEGGFGWQIVNNELQVVGAGDLPDYTSSNSAPWRSFSTGIKSAAVYGEVTAVGDYCFSYLSNMRQIALPDTVRSLDAYAFDSSGLTGITMPAALESIGERCFQYCSSLAEIEYNDRISSIGKTAYLSCNSLTDVVIPGSVSNLADSIFWSCRGLTSITVEEGLLKTLPMLTNNLSTNLREVRLPASLISLGSLPACACYIISPDHPDYTTVDGVIFSKDLTKLLYYPARKEAAYYRVPEETTSIRQAAFNDAVNLRFLDMSGSGVTNIDYYPMYACENLSYVNLPAGLTEINGFFFTYCKAEKLFVPASVSSVSTFGMNGLSSHVYTDDPNAAVIALCSAAGAECTVLPGHTHSFTETVYTQDASCTAAGCVIRACVCGQFEIAEDFIDHDFTAETVDENALYTGATCSAAARYYYSCAVCGAVEGDPEHTFTSGGPIDHDWQWVNDIEPTCGTAGVRHEECAFCHEKRNENSVLAPTGEHNFTLEAVKENALYQAAGCETKARYYYSCAKCGAVEQNDDRTFESGSVLGHNYAVTENTASTCTVPGRKVSVCSRCGDVQSETKPLADHTPVTVPGTPATCTATGLTDGVKCGECGKTLTAQTVIPKTGHNYAVTENTASTCTVPGRKVSVCSRCGDVQSETKPLADHTPVTVPGTPATCTAEGLTDGVKCGECGKTLTAQTVIPKTAHTYGAWTVTRPATCTENGVETRYCTVCGTPETHPVAKVGHRDNNGDGLCDYGCGTVMGETPTQPTEPSQPSGGDKCPLCGETHTGFFGKIVGFFHRIAYFFQNLFRR